MNEVEIVVEKFKDKPKQVDAVDRIGRPFVLSVKQENIISETERKVSAPVPFRIVTDRLPASSRHDQTVSIDQKSKQETPNPWLILNDPEMDQKQRQEWANNRFKKYETHNVLAVPKQKRLPVRCAIQPLPGLSYLSTSKTFCETPHQPLKKISKTPTRRFITKNRITSNILNFN